ncbi:ankyrin repeat-containing protein NPR4-like [Pistacia vera]|uniref:ankyrin repeat-containing protein NPR4-like n=1 Tax=Pistacia vera TaxID=55513 RepID=UPI0012634743|nr:ankyrin repeat-containing protein NPR4-like [Pistacia vera]
MNKEDLAVKNNAGNTAFFLAVASERVEIFKAMMKKNEDRVKIRGANDILPLHKAALIGDKETVEYLYEATADVILDHDNDLIELLISLINRGWYDNDVKRDVIKRCQSMLRMQRVKERNKLSLGDQMNEKEQHINEKKQRRRKRLGWRYRAYEAQSQVHYKEGNNILHLAAKLPPVDTPDIESPVVTCLLEREIWWFEGVKRILHPVVAEAKNNERKTPRALFTEQYKELREKADKWTKKTANACIMVLAIIATVVFAALFTVPGGTKENIGTPNFLRRASFIVFAISDTIALLVTPDLRYVLKIVCIT